MEEDFLNRMLKITEENLADEHFGVSELAREIGMSRSNLLRRVKKQLKISVSQYINQVRLNKAMDLLSHSSMTVSEISYKVGFSSTSYFIKCFRDYYGYPPGEAGKRNLEEIDPAKDQSYVKSHQLAAIMFTDIQGYTALMQQNEEKAIEYRNRHREVFNHVTRKFNGRILQYYGDGTLSTFTSAIDAVKCGIELQMAYQEFPQIPVRIGIHTGDIIVNKEEIIGDGVNIASRIESLATVGSVFISEKVYDEVKNQSAIQTASMGIFELKNVKKPLEVFAIANRGLVVPSTDQISGKAKNLPGPSSGKFWTKRKKTGIRWAAVVLTVMVAGYLLISNHVFESIGNRVPSPENTPAVKSIAVLPFINDSNDSSNIYFINGLMESILDNLQKIKDLRVVSRTSVEKYRRNPKTIQEMANELHVNYFIEGSGQKIGDKIFLNVQLIGAPGDNHLWSEQYTRETSDIFSLQVEVARSIASTIEVIITPEEEERINKPPTDDLVAYDYFLKGREQFYQGTYKGLEESIVFFKKAIEQDPQFAWAYADIAISYYFMDAQQLQKNFLDEINSYADKALLYDDKLPQSLVAKAFYYMNSGKNDLALSYLQKALEYNPNSVLVINSLSDFYTNIRPDSRKYLEYALKGIQLNIAANDSNTISVIYLHVSNAFIQTGFIDQAEKFINKSLDYNPDFLYSVYLKSYIHFARNKDLAELRDQLIKALNRDPSRLDIIQEVGKICYYMRDYEAAYIYYRKFLDIREAQDLNIYYGEDGKIGYVLSKVGREEEAGKYFDLYKEYAENDQTIYKDLSLAAYYSYKGDTDKAIEHMRLFSEQDSYYYWTVIFLQLNDPLFDPIRNVPEYRKLIKKIENNFWKSHDEIRVALEGQNLL